MENNTELDKASAIKIMGWKKGVGSVCNTWFIDKSNKFTGFDLSDWSPSTKNSGQIFDVLDAMCGMRFKVRIHYEKDWTHIDVFDYKLRKFSTGECEDNSKRNATILETCLEALEKREINDKNGENK